MFLVFVAMGAWATAARAEMPLASQYVLQCSGCHGAGGHGVPDAGIPDLANAGGYVVLPEGRAYLVQVPGISQSRMDDAAAARMLNYVLARFSAARLPVGFVPYAAAEVARLRADAASDAETRRARVLAALAAQGAVPGGYRRVP